MKTRFRPIREEVLNKMEGAILEVGSEKGVNFEHFNAHARIFAKKTFLVSRQGRFKKYAFKQKGNHERFTFFVL